MEIACKRGLLKHITTEARFDPDSTIGKLKTWSKRMDAASKKMKAAQDSEVVKKP